MLGFSTSWMSQDVKNGDELLRISQELGIKFLELDYRISERLFIDLKPKLKTRKFTIVSIHNFFPFPEEFSFLKPSGDLFLLSSLDNEEREKAIKFTFKTIRIAHDLECQAVVLHLGRIEMDSYHKQFCHYFDSKLMNSPEMDLFLSKIKKEREFKQKRFLDAVLFSLERIAREAEKRGVCLGIENRYYFHEIPNFEEIGIILQNFAGSKIYYWHDIGHGHVQEQLRIQSHQQLLEAYSPYILGSHFHDAHGYTDHEPPGKGEVNFGCFRKYLKDETVKVLEIRPQATFEEIQKGLLVLRNLGYE